VREKRKIDYTTYSIHAAGGRFHDAHVGKAKERERNCGMDMMPSPAKAGLAGLDGV